jgi:hypothetical protein
MNEAEWNDCDEPDEMIAFLHQGSERKRRLFAVACCRRLWRRLTDERSRNAVEVAERFAEGAASLREAAFAASRSATSWWDAAAVASAVVADPWRTAGAARSSVARNAADPAYEAGEVAGRTATAAAEEAWNAAYAAERAAHANLLRCIFGNPFRPPPALLTFNDGLVTELAEAAYELRSLPGGELDPTRLCILADALEEAGADDVFLEHLRSPGPHFRGCFALDAVLGKS